MIALSDRRHDAQSNLAEKVIARLPESVFGNTEWATMTTHAGAEHLRAAIASNRPYRIANALRSMAHAPNLDDVRTLAETICDALTSEAYSASNSESIAHTARARQIITSVMVELRGKLAPVSPDLDLMRETVGGYIKLVGLQDPALSYRLEAVGTFAERLARFMKLSPATILDAQLGGALHDIGMVEVPRPLRAKTVGLTKRDEERLKQHPQTGEAFLRSIPSLAHLAPVVRAHHERYDGLGFPDGLSGDEIPMASRIIGVAAAFVDLVTGSARFEAMLPHDACRELIQTAGLQFDPDVVTATLHLLHYRRRTNRSA